MARRSLRSWAGVLWLATAAAGTPARAQPKPPTRSPAWPLAATIGDYARAHQFSGTILVERAGRTIYHERFGFADRAFVVPVALDTKFRIASITKLFTAVLVLQLRDQGRLDLQARIRTYLPGYPGEGADSVTVHQLLNHTSGIENYDRITSYEEAVTKGVEVYQLPHTTDELLTKYASGKLVHPAGTAFDYNNADYVILGKIVERLTGGTYDDALRARILVPLGMRATGMLYQQEIIPGLAPTYMRVDSTRPPINDMPFYMQNLYAAGGMYSTATDLRAFARALYGGRLLKPEALRLLLTPGLDDYGYGLWVATAKIGGTPHRFAQRPGRVMGANVTLLRYLDDDVTVIILSNTNLTDIDAFGFLIGRTVIE